jgi:hypothetical protein
MGYLRKFTYIITLAGVEITKERVIREEKTVH